MEQRHASELARLAGILARLQSSLGPLSGEPVALSGGITNHNFRVTFGGEEYVVRVHGRDTQLLGIDRGAERLAGELAARIGIAPTLVAAFDDCLVTRFIPCDPVSQLEVAENVQELAHALRTFHESAAVLPARFWVPDLLTGYAARVHERGVGLPSAYAEATGVAARIANAMPLRRPRPCHNDMLASNIIRARSNARMLIVDWEYAGMGHAYFDLGNLSVNNNFTDADDERLLHAYHDAPPTDAQRAALALMRILSDAREAAWGVVQAEVSDVDFDFNRYARVHFERLHAAVEQPRLKEWLAAAANMPEEHGGQAA
jgi:thiamine kinase-like enzyme